MSIEMQFAAAFGHKPAMSRFTPGRVNLIGEHTDYNGGMVLPTAVPLGLHFALSPRDDGAIHIQSDTFDGKAIRNLSDSKQDDWSDYAVGSIILAREAGWLSSGADLAVSTTLPFGAGLSSSAALCVGVLKLARDLSGDDMSDTEISKLARRVENEFIGMPCGIMDQMAVAIATEGTALALDTDSLDYDLVTLPDTHQFVVVHSGVFRELAEGRYKIRKEECDIIKAALGREDICRMTDKEFASLSDQALPIIRRARHVMTEHRRTVAAVDALCGGDMAQMGVLMYESHMSMRDDFENSVPPMDALVETAMAKGALGARMTGGGFGGCMVACVAKEDIAPWSKAVLNDHPDAFFVC